MATKIEHFLSVGKLLRNRSKKVAKIIEKNQAPNKASK